MSDPSTSYYLDAALGPEGSQTLARRIADAAAKRKDIQGAAALAMFAGAVATAIQAALHIDLIALFSEGWSTAQGVRNAKRADGLSILKLGKHSVTRTLKPVITLSGMRQPLDMAIVLTGAFEGVALSVGREGIVSLGSGKCNVSVGLMLMGQQAGDPMTLQTWELPGERRFDPPLPLP